MPLFSSWTIPQGWMTGSMKRYMEQLEAFKKGKD